MAAFHYVAIAVLAGLGVFVIFGSFSWLLALLRSAGRQLRAWAGLQPPGLHRRQPAVFPQNGLRVHVGTVPWYPPPPARMEIRRELVDPGPVSPADVPRIGPARG